MPSKIIEDIDTLIDLGVGDQYRLEHIKQSYLNKKTIWSSDEKYLEFLREKYLPIRNPKAYTEPILDKKVTYCGKCGQQNIEAANYCNNCGSSLHKVSESKVEKKVEQPSFKPKKEKQIEQPSSKPKKGSNSSDKIIAIAGISALVVAIAIAIAALSGDYMLSFDNSADTAMPSSQSSVDAVNSKCGSGTVFDETTNSCVLESMISDKDSGNSKCGPGTVFDETTNSCILG